MSLRCRVGDLAVVVSSANGSNLGLTVLVLRAHETLHGVWHVKCLGHGKTWAGDVPPGGVSTIQDDRLRPIRPDADPVDVEANDAAEATA
jgi:hypothetical protein